MSDFPEQHADDTRFAQIFSAWGVQTKMRRLMGVSGETFRRMLDPDDAKHPSDLHRGRRLVAAAYEYGEETGDEVWAEFEGAKATGRGGRAEAAPVGDAELSRALNDVTSALLDKLSDREQLRGIRRAISLLKRREAELVDVEDYRGGGESPERADTQEAGTHGRTPAAASGLDDGLEAEEGEQFVEQARAAGGGRAVGTRLVGVTHAAIGADGRGGEAEGARERQ